MFQRGIRAIHTFSKKNLKPITKRRLFCSSSKGSPQNNIINTAKATPSPWLYTGLIVVPTSILFLNINENDKSLVHAGFFDSDTDSKNKLKAGSFGKVDELYKNGSWDELYVNMAAIYESSDKTNPEIIWRYSRAAFEMSKQPDIQNDFAKKKKFVYDAFEAAKLGLAKAPNHFKIHLWYGILLNAVGEIEGSKVKIKNLPTVKDHWIKASELNPKDGTALNLLGRWCKGIVEIDWFSRQIANTIFGKIPETSYEEALSYFMKAEELEPGFYLSNQLSIAQCLIAMKRKNDAKEWLIRSLELPVVTEEDKNDRQEVEKLLTKMK